MSPENSAKNMAGQGLVEFALVVIFLFTVIFGVLVLAQLFHTRVVLNNSAREGVRYLSLHPTDNTVGYVGTKAAAVAEAKNSGVGITASDVIVTCFVEVSTGFCQSGIQAQVRVGKAITLSWQWLFPGEIPLEGQATMMVP